MSDGSDANEERVFDAVFHEYNRALYAFLYGRTGVREHAEDLLQQVFVRVWRHISEVCSMPPEKVRPWLYTVAGNAATDHHRRESARVQALTVETRDIGYADTIHEEAANRETLAKLGLAIQNLPDEMRTAFTMTVLGDMSSEEVGLALSKPAGTVRSLVHDARKRLAREVG